MPSELYLNTTESTDIGMVRVKHTGKMIAISGDTNAVPENVGLGDIPTRWPDLRVIGEPTVTGEASHLRAVVRYKLPYEFSPAFCAELVGWPYKTAGGYRRRLPEPYRNWSFVIGDNWQLNIPGITPMWCTKFSHKGQGIRADWKTQNPLKPVGTNLYYPDPVFEWAIVDAVFETMAYDIKKLTDITVMPGMPAERQRYVYKSEDSQGRYLQYQTGQWVLKNGADIRPAGNRNQNYWEAFETITYEWFDVLEGMTNHAANQKKCGKTNNATFDGKPAGTLLLMKAGRIPTMSPIGQRLWKHTFEFLHAPTGVNKALPPGVPIRDGDGNLIYWDIVNNADHTHRPYESANMDALFMP